MLASWRLQLRFLSSSCVCFFLPGHSSGWCRCCWPPWCGSSRFRLVTKRACRSRRVCSSSVWCCPSCCRKLSASPTTNCSSKLLQHLPTTPTPFSVKQNRTFSLFFRLVFENILDKSERKCQIYYFFSCRKANEGLLALSQEETMPISIRQLAYGTDQLRLVWTQGHLNNN